MSKNYKLENGYLIIMCKYCGYELDKMYVGEDFKLQDYEKEEIENTACQSCTAARKMANTWPYKY